MGIAIAVLLVLLVAGIYFFAKATKWSERRRIKSIYLIREAIRLEREATRDEHGRFKAKTPEVVTELPKMPASNKSAASPLNESVLSFEQEQDLALQKQAKEYENARVR